MGETATTNGAALIPPALAFSDTDAHLAYQAWGCNCGPAALAACLGLTPEDVRPHFAGFRGFVSPTEMRRAVESAGYRVVPTDRTPAHGLCRVQWGGPWLLPGVPVRARYRYTHWIATKTLGATWVYDINAGSWIASREWERRIVPMLTREIKRADGSYSLVERWEVRH